MPYIDWSNCLPKNTKLVLNSLQDPEVISDLDGTVFYATLPNKIAIDVEWDDDLNLYVLSITQNDSDTILRQEQIRELKILIDKIIEFAKE